MALVSNNSRGIFFNFWKTLLDCYVLTKCIQPKLRLYFHKKNKYYFFSSNNN